MQGEQDARAVGVVTVAVWRGATSAQNFIEFQPVSFANFLPFLKYQKLRMRWNMNLVRKRFVEDSNIFLLVIGRLRGRRHKIAP